MWRDENAIRLVATTLLGYNVCAASIDAHNVSRGRSYMADKSKGQRGVTRRQFMKALPVGVVSALAVGVVSGRLTTALFRRNQTQSQLPEDSIFAPAKGRQNRT